MHAPAYDIRSDYIRYKLHEFQINSFHPEETYHINVYHWTSMHQDLGGLQDLQGLQCRAYMQSLTDTVYCRKRNRLPEEFQSETICMLLLISNRLYVQCNGLTIQCRLWLGEFSGGLQLGLTIRQWKPLFDTFSSLPNLVSDSNTCTVILVPLKKGGIGRSSLFSLGVGAVFMPTLYWQK